MPFIVRNPPLRWRQLCDADLGIVALCLFDDVAAWGCMGDHPPTLKGAHEETSVHHPATPRPQRPDTRNRVRSFLQGQHKRMTADVHEIWLVAVRKRLYVF
jgi:hypothetical protein